MTPPLGSVPTARCASPRGPVLLVEDDAGYARLVELMLEDGFERPVEVIVACTVADACARLLRGDVGCVLLDLSLPDGQGPELLDRLRAVAPAVPVIVQSGSVEPGLVAELVARGAVAFVSKDHEPGALVAAVGRALGGTAGT